jgi:hypothetical protein
MEPETDASANSDILSGGNRSTMGSGTGKSGVVLTVKPGEPAPAGSSAAGTSSEDVNANPSGDSSAPGPAATDSSSSDPAASPAGTDASTASQSSSSSATDSSKTDTSQPSSDANQKESSSKKKGIKKLIPW